MPLDAPAIIGDNTLTDFQTAADLFGYVSRRMPFDKPGELAADDYWAVVAYLLAERGTPPGSAGLNAKNAGSVPVK